ncbi:cx9C motif-containing protein 4 isoform X1 [Terrapene carolina triunguis]|uniref:Cx9C motif-containing protein 4 n=2 Tax=Emydidae TaxID=8476 RepID=A0A674IBR1_9SAUR|nr:cx9C motif-containing protein 4 isoform X1 [Terrapene carolina triunguis]
MLELRHFSSGASNPPLWAAESRVRGRGQCALAAGSPNRPGPRSSVDMPQKDPCQKQACEIQKCLQANNYLEARCEAVLQEMRRCCAQCPKGRSICCSGFEKEEREREKLKAASNGNHAAPQ